MGTLRKTVRLRRMQRAMRDAVTAIFGADFPIVWAFQQTPRDPKLSDPNLSAFMKFQVLQGATHIDSIKDEQQTAELVTATTLTIETADLDKFYGIELNCFTYAHLALVTDTRDTIAAALVAEINAQDAQEIVTAAVPGVPTGPGEMILTPDFVGGIYQLRLFPAADITRVDDPRTPAVVVNGPRSLIVSCQVFCKNTTLEDSAAQIAADFKAGLDLPEVREAFQRNNVTIGPVSPGTDLTAIAGAKFETREQFNLTLTMQSVITGAADIIEEVTVQPLANLSTDTITVPPPAP